VKKITTMVNETISQARDLARGLSPVELENNGLQARLQELASRVSRTKRELRFESADLHKGLR
jgi:signal transduction histidine kinase